jgi:hypothetical protein
MKYVLEIFMTNKNNKVMKVSVPEKIYFSQLEDGRQYFTPAIPFEREFVEYMPVNAFIEKAALWLLTNASDYCILHNSYDTKGLVKDFVDAIKRE